MCRDSFEIDHLDLCPLQSVPYNYYIRYDPNDPQYLRASEIMGAPIQVGGGAGWHGIKDPTYFVVHQAMTINKYRSKGVQELAEVEDFYKRMVAEWALLHNYQVEGVLGDYSIEKHFHSPSVIDNSYVDLSYIMHQSHNGIKIGQRKALDLLMSSGHILTTEEFNLIKYYYIKMIPWTCQVKTTYTGSIDGRSDIWPFLELLGVDGPKFYEPPTFNRSDGSYFPCTITPYTALVLIKCYPYFSPDRFNEKWTGKEEQELKQFIVEEYLQDYVKSLDNLWTEDTFKQDVSV